MPGLLVVFRRVAMVLAVLVTVTLTVGCPLLFVPWSAPGSPTGLSVSAISSTSVSLAWQDESRSEVAFRVERKTGSGGTYSRVGVPSRDSIAFTDDGLTEGTTYSYRICAFNQRGDSAYSNEISVTTPPKAPSGLAAVAVSSSQINLSWTDNSSKETGFKIEASPNASSGWDQVGLVSADVTSYSHTGLAPSTAYYYRLCATSDAGCSASSATATARTTAPSGTFKVVNSWGVGFAGEKVPDGYYFITYAAVKNAQIFSMFMEDRSSYNPTLLVTLQMSHPRRGDCKVWLCVGTHEEPVRLKWLNQSAWLATDPHGFPANVMAFDITELASQIDTSNLFLAVFDASTADGGTTDRGTIDSFAVEKYTTYGGSCTTLTAAGLPRDTVDGSWVYVDINTAGAIGSAAASRALEAPSRISSLVNAHPMTSAELSGLKARVGVAEKGKNYNVVIGGHGTGLRPPTEEQWAEIQKSTLVIDSLKSPNLGEPPSVDLSSRSSFPPVGDQGSQGSCVAWSTAYYIKTFQEALEHLWDLSTIRWSADQPDTQLDHIMSPTWVYNQINGGVDEGGSYLDAADILCSLGAATWQAVPYTVTDATSWPTAAGYRDAPPHRGIIPAYSDWGTNYCLYVTTDAGIAILKTLLANDIPVSISIDAEKYPSLSADDVWDVPSYPRPLSTNHANTLVGYSD